MSETELEPGMKSICRGAITYESISGTCYVETVPRSCSHSLPSLLSFETCYQIPQTIPHVLRSHAA